MATRSGTNRKTLVAAQTLTGGVVGLGLLGYFIDQRFGTSPYLLLTGLFLGLMIGFYDLWKAMFPRKDDD